MRFIESREWSASGLPPSARLSQCPAPTVHDPGRDGVSAASEISAAANPARTGSSFDGAIPPSDGGTGRIRVRSPGGGRAPARGAGEAAGVGGRSRGESGMSVKGVEISYLYRDASDCKTYGATVVAGHLRMEDLEPFLFEGEFFIPEVVGLPFLRPRFFDIDDHHLHVIDALSPTEISEIDGVLTAETLLSNFKKAWEVGWFETLSSISSKPVYR